MTDAQMILIAASALTFGCVIAQLVIGIWQYRITRRAIALNRRILGLDFKPPDPAPPDEPTLANGVLLPFFAAKKPRR